MKIAIVLAICVIFVSGTYAAFAEEPIPTLTFEGGDYTIYRGNQILVPITIQIENHDHKIFPKINTIYENQISSTLMLGQSSSGYYHTFLNINENYATGSYYLQLDYDGKKLTPIPFNIIREFEEQIERTTVHGDYLSSFHFPKDSHIDVSIKNIDVEFSTVTKQYITGEYDSRGISGKINIKIDGPKSMLNNVLMSDVGKFETYLIIDREWPTGTYKINGMFNEKIFATSEFIIKNYNKDSLLKDLPIEGSINLHSVKSNQFDVILIEGQLSGDSLPKQIAMKVFHEGNLIDTLYNDVKDSGSFETSIVLYDHLKKSNWDSGKYTIEIVNSGTLETYGIKSDFKISKKGNTITELEEGALLTSNEAESQSLDFIEEINIEKYHPKVIKVFWNY